MDFRPSQPAHPAHHVAADAATPTHNQNKGASMFKRNRMMMMWLVVGILLIVAAGTAVFYVKKYNDSQKQVQKLVSNPTLTAQQQQQDLISKIGKLTNLPTGETPTIATVTDITKLAGQPFFANAKNGDKVLIYTGAKEAYLYRPSTNKLINIAPVNLGSNTSSTGTTTTPTTTNTTKKP